MKFQIFKLDLEKAEEPKIKLPTSTGSSKKQESSRKTSTTSLLTTPKPLTAWIIKNCGKFFKRWEYQTTLPAFYAGQEATIRTGRAHCCLYPELQPTWENTLPLHTGGPHGPNTHNLLHWASPTQGLRALLHPVMPLANGDQGTTPTWCMKQQTGSKSGKEYVKAVYCHLAYLTYMQSISCKMPGWMKYKWESRLPEEMSMTPGHRWHHPFGRKWRGT